MNKYSQDNTPYTSLPFPANFGSLPPYLENSQSNLLTQMANKLQYPTLNPFLTPQQLIYQQLAQQNSLQSYQLYYSTLLQLKQQQENQLIQQTLLANVTKEDDLPIRNASPSSSQLSSITGFSSFFVHSLTCFSSFQDIT